MQDIKISDAAKELAYAISAIMYVVDSDCREGPTAEIDEAILMSKIQTTLNAAHEEGRRLALEEEINYDEYTVMNLVSLIRRLARQLMLTDKTNKTANQALDYLRRNGCEGNILREALSNDPPSSPWQDIATAPKDGTTIIIKMGGMSFPVKWGCNAIDERGDDCDCWVATEENHHPECWSDGVCWSDNVDSFPSEQPTHWMPIPNKPAGGG